MTTPDEPTIALNPGHMVTAAAASGAIPHQTTLDGVFPGTPASSTFRLADAGFVAKGHRPKFADETELLLRARLKAAAINLTFVLGLGYVLNWISQNHSWLGLRTTILALVVGAYVLLQSNRVFKLPMLRLVELILFGGVAIQIALMMYTRIGWFAKQDDATSMTSAQAFYFTAFCLHVLTYGIFIPNNWRRAAMVTGAIACIPYAVWNWLLYSNADVARLAALNHAAAPLPTTLVAAVIGTFGSHIIYRTRREAFQAKQILQYRLQEKIGSGGMGEVYRAEHILLKRPCAMKIIKLDRSKDKKSLDRFEREVIATAKLSHWNTVDIYDYGHTEDGTFYYVMELLRGENLQTLIQLDGPMPPARVAYLVAQVCDALAEAHEVGLIHRDIKPANIFVSCRGGVWDVVKLLDFGLVRELTNAPIASNEEGSGFSGTPQFMSPEQATRYDSVDGRSDLYALGAVGFYLLTGHPPFERKNLLELVLAHANAPIPSLASINAQTPPDLEEVIVRCLAKDANERFQSAEEVARALRACVCYSEWNAEYAKRWWMTRSDTESQSPRRPEIITNASFDPTVALTNKK